ncbi:hypothetical protein FV232_22215 [Methylobacterium sp. WL30]|uniref:hypothetical protein n=1 Tax=unclassified Methylobacterium TaxID=2615210 RepID=UPI0011C8F1D8|nr:MULTISPECIES: hypothetical protein [unclassified Methylobacterium]TXN39597.1 hypothetical protein FV225_09350 [Methylobacterium sp. WL93]TXN45218.1 hypothetical protein FV227_25400 [Methylobacterium sp. WL119]TXN63909.1 hypothetical protein FV232_22215 [Methylobacterium sp. WL30]
MTSSPERLSEVSRLAGLLADQVLDAQIMSRPILDQHIRALLDAALLLDKHSIPLPALLMQIVHEIDKDTGRMAAAEEVEQAEVKGMAWLLRPFQGRKEP